MKNYFVSFSHEKKLFGVKLLSIDNTFVNLTTSIENAIVDVQKKIEKETNYKNVKIITWKRLSS